MPRDGTEITPKQDIINKTHRMYRGNRAKYYVIY